MSIQKELNAMQPAWDTKLASSHEVGVVRVPEGVYTVDITEAKITHATTGKLMINWHLAIVDGEYAGRLVFKNSVIDPSNQQNVDWLTSDLAKLGLDPHGKLSSLPQRLASVVGTRLKIKQGTSSVFFNTVVSHS